MASTTKRHEPIILVGPMGAGKSTVGRKIAQQLGTYAVDSDEEFELQHGKISDFFSKYGEPQFRDAEENLIAQMLKSSDAGVISLGGGSVIRESTRRVLPESGFVVFVDINTQAAMDRLGQGEGRPILEGDPAGRWEHIRAQRVELYQEVSQFRIDTTDLSIATAAQVVVEKYQAWRKSPVTSH